MQLWTDFITWLNSTNGHYLISNAILPFLAIIVAGIIAALIGRSSAKRVIALSDREVKASAVTALISAARKAAVWNTLPAPEQQHVDHLIGDADIRLRLLPVAGTGLAADWARHEIADMKRNAVSFSFQAEQTLIVFRDRLIDWQARPTRAKKLFKNDLDSWAYDSSLSEQELVHQQQEWAASQVDKTGSIDVVPTASVAAPVSAPAAAAPVATPAASAPAPVVPALSAPQASPAGPPAASAPDFAPFSVTSPAETEPETPVFSRFTSRFARPVTETPATETPTAETQAETAELVEPSVPLHSVDRRDDFEGTPSFIEPERNDTSEELPEIIVPASDEPDAGGHNQPATEAVNHTDAVNRS